MRLPRRREAAPRKEKGKTVKSHSYIVLYILFTLLFTSCATSPAPTASATVVSSETPQPTQALTETPTQLPTITPTATEAGPKVGDQITENGYTYTYMEIRSPETNEVLYTGFFREVGNFDILPNWGVVPNGNGGWTQPLPNGGDDLGPTKLLIEKGVSGEQAVMDLILTHYPSNQSVGPMYYNEILTGLTNGAGHVSISGMNSFMYNLLSGNQHYNFTYNGVTYPYTFSRTSGGTIFVLTNDPTIMTKENGFSTWTDMPWKTKFSTAFWGVDSRGLIGAISFDKSMDKLDPYELRMLALWHELSVIDIHGTDDMSNVGFDGLVQRVDNYAAAVSPPVIDVQYQK